MNLSQFRSRQQERRAAKELGGRVTPASGSTPFCKSDVYNDTYRFEAKRTDKGSISIKLSVWKKVRKEALLTGREPALLLNIAGEQDLVVISETHFKELTNV